MSPGATLPGVTSWNPSGIPTAAIIRVSVPSNVSGFEFQVIGGCFRTTRNSKLETSNSIPRHSGLAIAAEVFMNNAD